MKILVVGIIRDVQVSRLKEEAKKRGHTLDGCLSKDLVIFTGPSEFKPTLNGKSLNEYDLIYFWSLGYKRWEWYTACRYLREKHGTIVVDENAVTQKIGYTTTPTLHLLLQSENNLPFPSTGVVFHGDSIDEIKVKFDYPVIVKESVLHQGAGVYLANSSTEVKKIINSKKVEYPYLVREFIPNDGDIRVFTVGFKAVAAMKRIPKEGEFRSNISLGGTGENYDLSKNPMVKDLAERAAKLAGIQIAGADIVLHKETQVPYILEINDGPQFRGIEKYTQANIAGSIIEYFAKLHAERH